MVPTEKNPARYPSSRTARTPPGSVGTPSSGPTPSNSKRRRIMQGAVICAAVNAALSVAAVLTHQYALTTVCLILTPLIYTILILLLLMLVQSPGATRPRTRPH